MKRIISLLLACLLLCPSALAAPGSSAANQQNAAAISGVWTLTAIEIGGVSYNPARFGLQMTLTFAIDGGFISDDGTQATVSTWQFIDGGIQAGKATLVAQDDFLTLVSGSNTLFFSHTEHYDLYLEATPLPEAVSTPAPTPTPTPSPDEARAPYCGEWILTTLVSGGVSFSPASFGLQMTLTLGADGSFLSSDGTQTTAATWQVDGDVIRAGNAVLTATEDGRLSLVTGSNTLIFTRSDALPTPTPAPTPTPTPTPAPTLPPAMQALSGVWYLCYCSGETLGDMTGDPRGLGLTGTLSLYDSKNGHLKVLWDGGSFLDERETWFSAGDEVYFGGISTPLTLVQDATGDTFLRYGTDTDYLLFHRSETAVWTPAVAPAAPVQFGVTYICNAYTMEGVTFPDTGTDEVTSICLQENGTCALTLFDMTSTTSYTFSDEKYYVSNYFFGDFVIVPTSTGLDMVFSDMGMTFHMVPTKFFTREGFTPTTDEALLLGAEPVGEEGVPFLGTWALTGLIMEGESIDPALFGLTMTLTFMENGTVVSDDGFEPYTTT